MGRPASGQVVVDARGEHARYALRFRAYGKRHYLALGSAAEGWTRGRAMIELENVLADVRRGIWRPPEPEPAQTPLTDPTFHVFASRWLAAKRAEIRPNTARSYHSDLTLHLLPFFAQHRLSQITVAEVDRYRGAKVREGRLKARSINMHLALLAQILEVAVEYGHLARNPAAGRRRRLRASKPRPVHLDATEHLEAMLQAAADLDGRPGARTGGRRAALAVMLLAGLRAEEVGALLWRDVDLASGRLYVGRAKTDAGMREVDMLPLLRDVLAEHKSQSRQARLDDRAFVTSTGVPRDRHNLRQRVVAPIVRRADELLAERGAQPLPAGISPHKLRHTFASLLVALGNDPAYVMAQLGHSDPAFTLRVYAHMMRRAPGERERLRALVEGREIRDSPGPRPRRRTGGHGMR